jgi:hypothetical protein
MARIFLIYYDKTNSLETSSTLLKIPATGYIARGGSAGALAPPRQPLQEIGPGVGDNALLIPASRGVFI